MQDPAGPGRSDRPPWWQSAVICQVYPLSFQDSDGDGRGDLPGLLSRLDYLCELGIDAIWLAPVYCSPMRDFGYDVADFTGIEPCFGSLGDFDRLVQALHERGMRLVLDFVPNHTADTHPWFVASRSSRNHPQRDWYVWADAGPDGGPPNRWTSRFGGSAWEYDAGTGQYYYHAFLKEQPDLNWHNPEVRQAMAEVLRFWQARGVDGFRIDAAAVLAEDVKLREDPPKPDADGQTPEPERVERVYTDYRPEVLDWLAELRRCAEADGPSLLLGEVDGSGDRIVDFYGDAGRPILHLPLNYRLIDTDWQGPLLRETVEHYLTLLDALGPEPGTAGARQGGPGKPKGWPCWAVGSHDKPRVARTLGPERARLAALLLFTLPGTALFFAGDELGLEGCPVPSEQSRDPFERQLPGFGLNRDPQRAPMPWSDAPQAGFTTGEPWLPLEPGHEQRHVARQQRDPASMWSLYRRLIALRKAEAALGVGSCFGFFTADALLGFQRAWAGRRLQVVVNLAGTPQVHRPDDGRPARLLLSTRPDPEAPGSSEGIRLEGYEGVVLVLD
ncbi:alpha-amylase family glycosyl hydrolase [Aquabacterium sp. A7-Y]|uniref:alpha-amylase family glycosyl hydrolase n=1 Tax=Aquabacterium sp. A7-Y TaxID=1349605 RepID=UPI00223DA761|nr:alpha-amylase family glycosyl hydrolase [Aquabacterium sp. A7-Y]MCW7538344.1 alpha-amylase family glycosyl hydrolase [Aquabacterium sp. A7-Y]